ncbi:uncharacterized protein LOC108913103 [Anoplophora glabripennis]|uniref:uncharacterized protein LOC108913103 n=1 Tax=Anoplophora glabripennis TaxID=217634 RepID=UPI0008756C05|nr:uncharacterized protein LOC108913103 [Anoplophora glabripennis]
MHKLVLIVVIGCLLFIANAFNHTCNHSSNLNFTRRRRYSNHNIEERCTLPPFPEHGEWKLLNGKASPGDKIPKNSVVKFECSFGYKLSQIQYRVCDDKWNSGPFPECEALCPPLYSSATVDLKCTDKRGKDIKCNEASEGTYLLYTCAPFYETPFGYKKTLLCSEGSWNYPKPVCQPVCGKTIVNDAKPLIFGSVPNKKLEYPWVTAVYTKVNNTFENICGGSILSLTVVLTAAHCVTNDYGDVLPKEDYLVGVGKLYNKYQAPEDKFAQYLELSKIIVHENYKGDRRRFLGDLAVLITKGAFTLNDVVQPVCFNDVNNIPLHAGSIGEISGWGKTESGGPSEVLRTLKIPYKYETTCAQELPPDWADKYNMIDKICAGFINQSTSVCSGDSGSGLAFKNPDDNRYYLHGLVSLGPTTTEGDCNIQQNSLYTKVAFYYEFIDRVMSKHTMTIQDCVLPSHPQNGKWTIDKQERKPGDAVPSNTLLKIKCNLGFKLSSKTTNIECGSAHNMPTCQLLCPPLMFPHGTEFRCTNKEGSTISCLDAVDGTTLYYDCPAGFKFPDGTTNIRSCVVGSWGSPQPECLPQDKVVPPPSPDSSISPTPNLSLVPNYNPGEEPSTRVVCVYEATRFYDNNVDPDDLDSSLCTYVIYSSVGLAADGSLNIQGSPVPAGGTKSLFQKVADMKTRNSKLKVLLRAEGSGDKNSEYPTMAENAEKRSTFIRSVVSFLEIYKFDGLDIYWNVPQFEDRDKYIDLLKAVKETFKPKGWLLAVSVYIAPTYIGYHVGKMNVIVDWVNIQNYNNYLESSNRVGQYSGFRSSSKEGDWEMEANNLVNSAKSWEVRGLAKDKLAVSVAFYGRYFTLKNPKKHDIFDYTVPGESGLLTYSEICQKYSNWTRIWDDEQKNPYKYSGNKWFGYDDPESVTIKAEYISDLKYFGVHIYSINADDVQGKCGPKQGLLKYVLSGLGFSVDLKT